MADTPRPPGRAYDSPRAESSFASNQVEEAPRRRLGTVEALPPVATCRRPSHTVSRLRDFRQTERETHVCDRERWLLDYQLFQHRHELDAFDDQSERLIAVGERAPRLR